jgi:GNAT superfamily N-acetyltransferase
VTKRRPDTDVVRPGRPPTAGGGSLGARPVQNKQMWSLKPLVIGLLGLTLGAADLPAGLAFADMDSVTRSRLEQRAFKARNTYELLVVAAEYQRHGLTQNAKAIVDRATTLANAPADWDAIARAYAALGYPENAHASTRKARELRR